jgi:outer membrane autotransporter protein
MKTKSGKITEGSARKLSSILAVIITAFLAPGGSAQVSSELFWDGPSQIPNMVEGGNGFWSNATSEAANWCTDNTGRVNIPWIDGSVAVFQATAGTVTVTDTIVLGGMIFHTNGYQIVSDGGILELVGSPTITTDEDVTATIKATLAGAAGITKEGLGTLILTAENTYLGTTTIDAGSLIVNFGGSIASTQTATVNTGGSLIVDGSIASLQTFVNAGGLLGGTGTIGGDLTNGGIVNPGRVNSPGKLTVAGDYAQTTSGTLQIEIGATQHDLLVVNGKATLAGTLQIIPLNPVELQPQDEITFLTAKLGVSGKFKTVENPFVLFGVDYSNPNSVTLKLLDVSAPPPYASIYTTGVSQGDWYATSLLRQTEYCRLGVRGLYVNINGNNFSEGLAGPTGPEGKSGPSVMQPTPGNRWGVFVTGLGEFTDVGDTGNTHGFDLTTGGLTFGVDYLVSPNFAIGLTGGYAHTNSDFVNNGSIDVNGGTIGAYATGFGGGFYVDAAAWGVFNGYDTQRNALLGTASGETDGQDFNALVAAGYDWKHGGLTIGPLASFQYTYVGLDGFTEHGSVAPLSFSDQNAESTRTTLGAKASYDWHVGHVVVRPELRAAWQHEFGDTEYSIVSRLADGAGNSFTVNGPAIGRDSLLLEAGAAVLLNDRVSVYAYYDGQLARTNYSSNNVSAGLRVSF